MMDELTIDIAYRLRFLRGLLLPIDGEYKNVRLKQIAIRETQLFTELKELDEEIKVMYNDWVQGINIQEAEKDKRKAQFDRF